MAVFYGYIKGGVILTTYIHRGAHPPNGWVFYLRKLGVDDSSALQIGRRDIYISPVGGSKNPREIRIFHQTSI